MNTLVSGGDFLKFGSNYNNPILFDQVIRQRDFVRKIHKEYNDKLPVKDGLYDLILTMGGVRDVFTDLQFNLTSKSLFQKLFGTVQAGASATTVTIALNASLMKTVSGAAFANVVAGDIVFIGNTGQTARIHAINTTTNPWQITLERPIGQTYDLSVLIQNDTELYPRYSVTDYANPFPKGRSETLSRFGVTFQTMQTSSPEVTPYAMNQRMDAQIDYSSDQAVFSRDLMNMMVVHHVKKVLACLYAKGYVYPLASGESAGATNKETMGFETVADTFGISKTFAKGAWTNTDLYEYSTLYDTRDAGTEVILSCGRGFMNRAEQLYKAELSAGAIVYAINEQGKSEALADGNDIHFGLRSIVLGGRKYIFHLTNEITHKELFPSYATNDKQHEFIAIPNSTRMVNDGKQDVQAPIVNILHLLAPARQGSPLVRTTLVDRNPDNKGALLYDKTVSETFAVQVLAPETLGRGYAV